MNFTSKSELMNWIDRYIDLVAYNLTCTEPSEYQLEITKKAYDQLKERVISLENKARGPSVEEIERLYKNLKEHESKARLVPRCECDGWGCFKCCSSEQEIRSKQGTFG